MDVFSILKSGIAFDKKRFRQDFEAFKPDSLEVDSCDKNTDKSSEEVLVDALDFFKVNEVNRNVKEKKERAKKQDRSKNFSDNSNEIKNVDEPRIVKTKAEKEADVLELRRKYRIRVYGTDVIGPFRNFEDMINTYKLELYLKKNLEANGYSEATPIQMQSIPIMLQGRDLISCAPTGSGKTLAFCLPILHHLKEPEKIGFRAVIITPTRELAIQIHREIMKMCQGRKFKICVLSKRGNANNENDMAQYKNFDILITTPLRLVHGLQTNTITLNNVKHLILDEADRLLELGFVEQVDEILASCTHPKLQKTLFSATISSSVEDLANSFMIDPIRVVIGQKNAATEIIDQKLCFVGSEEGKMVAMRQMIQKGIKPPVLIFVQSIERAKELFHELVYDNINVDVIHSERTKAQRDNIVYNFRVGKIWVLIATELMARGIDFKGVNLVINYDFPQSVASYIHRIGRTGRAGMAGQAVTFFTKEDGPFLKSVVNVMRDSGCHVPEWMLTLQKPSKNMKNNLKQHAPKRHHIKVVSKYDENKMKHKSQMIKDTKRRKLE